MLFVTVFFSWLASSDKTVMEIDNGWFRVSGKKQKAKGGAERGLEAYIKPFNEGFITMKN